MPKKWFKAKTYGYGWYPSTWQGWLCVLAYLAVVILTSHSFGNDLEKYHFLYSLIIFVSTVLLIYISYKKGEPASWRWGEDNKKIIKQKQSILSVSPPIFVDFKINYENILRH